jgi:hypothetical protein
VVLRGLHEQDQHVSDCPEPEPPRDTRDRIARLLVRALQERVNEANEGVDEEERVDLNHLIEVQLAECVTIADVARLERDVPGMSKAVSRWLAEIERGED